ncbi:MAG: hypothetical protein D6790_09715 [Caldilineae bacterium]|nr:MAG: hypothetical protein D6790_09715 [Caldilineae bacterium]
MLGKIAETPSAEQKIVEDNASPIIGARDAMSGTQGTIGVFELMGVPVSPQDGRSFRKLTSRESAEHRGAVEQGT